MGAHEGPDAALTVTGDPERAEALRSDGFVQIPVLSPPEVEQLRALFHELHPEAGSGCVADTVHPDEAHRRRTSAAVESVLGPAVRRALGDVQFVLFSFICKWPGDDSAKPLHRDWTHTPEPPNRSYSVWVPLVDVDERNGALQVLPGSHRYDSQPRGSAIEPAWLRHESLIRPHLVTQRCRAGTAMVYDAGLLHGSAPNLDAVPREVAGVTVIPAGAEVVHYHRIAPDQIGEYAVDQEFHRRYSVEGLYAEGPVGMDPGRILPFDPADLDEDELRQLLPPEPPAPRRRLLSRRPARWARPAGPVHAARSLRR